METTLLRLGHSPDPDDAFMFYALAKGLIPTGRWRFEHVLQDIQTLNHRARAGELEITAISIHAYPYVADKYALTSCGSSMGDGYGPMVVTRSPMKLEELRGKTIAIPGELTTAFLSLQLCMGKGTKARGHEGTEGEAPSLSTQHSALSTPAKGTKARRHEGTEEEDSSLSTQHSELSTSSPSPSSPGAFSYVVVPFDQILAYVQEGKADAGLIIHEGQLTFGQNGLHLVVDLGAWWLQKTGLPLPLGGNCIRKDLGQQAMQEITDILKQSIQFSLDHRPQAVEYALQYGRDLDRALADRFVGMYVNHWTIDYGQRGRDAISLLLAEGAKAGLVPDAGTIEYVTAR